MQKGTAATMTLRNHLQKCLVDMNPQLNDVHHTVPYQRPQANEFSGSSSSPVIPPGLRPLLGLARRLAPTNGQVFESRTPLGPCTSSLPGACSLRADVRELCRSGMPLTCTLPTWGHPEMMNPMCGFEEKLVNTPLKEDSLSGTPT